METVARAIITNSDIVRYSLEQLLCFSEVNEFGGSSSKPSPSHHPGQNWPLGKKRL
uniref:Uncharacterized protein n=1 Tax=Anguilla anguilla TaxID=7936 RepID=A0A0E9UNZ3_ANGAN